jgi:hypothetical protein
VNKRFNRILFGLGVWLALCVPTQGQPNILQGPINLLDQILGDPVTLTVKASTPTTNSLQYQWLRNGVIVSDATNTALTITAIQAIDCGAYSVLVSDGVGTVVSEPADVTVAGIDILQGVDQLLDALVLNLVSTSGVFRSYNTNAVKEPGTPDIIPGDPGGSEIWFKWSPPLLLLSGGNVTFSTLGSDFDTTVGVYTGSDVSDLTQVPTAINDDDSAGYLNSQVSFYAKYGTTYLIAIDGFYGAKGNVVMSWSFDPGSSAVPDVVPNPQSVTTSNGATVTLASPWPQYNCDWLHNGQVVVTNTNALVITNLGDTTVGSYVARLTTRGGFVMSSEPTEVQINTLQDGTTASNSAAWVKYLDSADSPFLATVVAHSLVMKLDGGGDTGGYSCAQTFSTVGNPDEPGEPIVCDQDSAHPGWYSYVTPVAGSLLIQTKGSTFNTVLGAYVGPGNSFDTLTNIGCGETTDYEVTGQPSVYIPNVPAGQTNYIVVEGEKGASGTVHLNIFLGNPVSISAPPQNQAAVVGSNVTLSVGATGATPLSYLWQFNGANIAGATDYALTIANFQPSNAGAYTVLVSNLVSQDSAQANVSLITLPEITNQPCSQSVSVGSNVTFTCAATSTVPMIYQWQFGSLVFPATTNTCLTLTNVQPTNAGTYVCLVSNAAGTVTSSNAVLTVQTPPVITTHPTSKTVTVSSTAMISVSATGTPAPNYQWFFNGVPVGLDSGSLSITNFAAANQGRYSVVLSNNLGVVTSAPAFLLLDGPLRIYSYGASNGSFSLQTAGVAGSSYTIEASSDLTNWIPLFTNYSPNGFLNFTDTNAGALPVRFYRASTNSP